MIIFYAKIRNIILVNKLERMMNMLKKALSAALALAAALSLASCSEAPEMPEPQISLTAPDRPSLGENFYGYCNYDYLSEGQIPYGKTGYGTMDSMLDDTIDAAYDIITRCVNGENESGSIEEMIKEIYLEFADGEGRNQAGAPELLQYAAMIEQCSNVDDMIGVMGVIYQELNVCSFIRPDIMPNIYDTSENIVCLMSINSLGNMKENFTLTDAGTESLGGTVYDALKAMEVGNGEAKERAKKVVSVIYEIMSASLDLQYQNDLDKHFILYDREKLRTLFSNIDVDKMLAAFGYSDADKIALYDVQQAEKVNEILVNDNLRVFKDYLITCIMYEYYRVLPPSFLDSSKTLEDFEIDADENAKGYVETILEHELGVLYGREVCTEKVMSSVEDIVSGIKGSYRELIGKCERLSDDAKEKYLKKLDNMIIKLGYDRNLSSPFTLTPKKDGGTLIGNVIAINRGRVQEKIHKLHKAPDRNEWGMSAVEVNATYYPMSNTFEIPACMMNRYILDPDKTDMSNYGGLGFVIGHEMSHAFDAQGFLFDETGNYKPDMISEEDKSRFGEVKKKVTEYYNNVKLLGVYRVNGEQTLSENIADLASVQCLLNIAKTDDDRRQIFEGIAKQWASLTLITDLIIDLEANVHSPGEARVNGVVADMDEFYEVYDVKETDKMYVAPEKRVKVW